MKKKTNKIAIVLIFLLGLSLLLYPLIANQWNGYRQKRLLSAYDQAVADKEASGEIDYEAEWERARAYNEALLPSILPDSFAVAAAEEDGFYMSCLNITGNGVMGKVEIPKIDIELPIFHTTEEDVLQNAAGHLEGSSLPIGGESAHAVISAHRGLPSAALFTDLDLVEKGDHFLLHILDDTLCYEVDKITVVEPEDTASLAVEDGKDLVTLLTCTPYGVNSERLLVRGHRVPYDPDALKGEGDSFGIGSLHTNYLLWVMVGLLVTAGFSLYLYKKEKRLERMKVKPEASTESEASADPQQGDK